jgi:signal transduction histidine kinase
MNRRWCNRPPCSHRRFSHSLSGRLILIFIGMALLFVLLVGGTMFTAFQGHIEDTFRPHLIQYVEYVQADIGTPPDFGRAAELSRRLPLTIRIAGPGGDWSSDGATSDLRDLEILHRVERNGREIAYGTLAGREYLVTHDGGYVFAYAVPHERSTWRLTVPLLMLLAILVLLYHATRRLFAPIQAIKNGVERIGQGEMDHRIAVSRRDELGDLAASINAMADDVQQMLDSKRQLLLAISHELRSPLTRAKVAANLVDDGRQRDEIERELNDLEKLVEELLETERLASRHQALHRQRIDLNELVRDVVEKLRDDRTPLLRLPDVPAEADADPVRLRLLLRNLLENALRHTPPGVAPPEVQLRVTVEAGATPSSVDTAQRRVIELSVRDFGPGIPSEHLPHVTEPFYRADPARQRETGGYGLGLYLCRRIAEVHGGTLEISSETPGGTCVTVRLFTTSHR